MSNKTNKDMNTSKITLTFTEKEFEILRRAITRYASEQMGKSDTFGKANSENFEDAAAIRARIAVDIQSKVHKKCEARPELNYISIF